jgi:nickel-type superoxide dismutase maturation protease
VLATTILALAVAFARWRPFRVEVTGASMRPTLEPGDWALGVGPGRRGLRRGDVVVFDHPERPGFEVVKRLRWTDDDPTSTGNVLWVMGDDPAGSTDSRQFGPVSEAQVRGRLVLIWWPPARFRRL